MSSDTMTNLVLGGFLMTLALVLFLGVLGRGRRRRQGVRRRAATDWASGDDGATIGDGWSSHAHSRRSRHSDGDGGDVGASHSDSGDGGGDGGGGD